jgi:cytoskeleton protein RodZ
MAEIGSTLREARMHAHIDISEVEARTKIRAKYLRAIENEEWDLLPGTVYVKSFLRTYADFLGLDSRLLIDEFKRRYERPADHEVRPMSGIGRERERGTRRRPRPSLSPKYVIAAALLVIVAALYLIGSNSNNSNPPADGAGSTATGGHHGKKPDTHPVTTTTTSKKTGTTTGTSTTTIPPAKATVAMTATGSVWICEKDAKGKLLIPGLIYSVGGVPIPTESARNLLISLGNGNVTMTVNGKAFPIARSAQPIGVKVNASGATLLTTSPTCG